MMTLIHTANESYLFNKYHWQPSQARPSLHQDISYKEHPNFQKSQLLALLSRNCLDVFPPFCPAIPQHHTMLPEKSMNYYLKFMNKQTWPIFLSLHFNFVPHCLLTLLKAITKWNAKVRGELTIKCSQFS